MFKSEFVCAREWDAALINHIASISPCFPSRQIPEYCTGHDEEAITAGVYQLIFAFDECISVGYKENVTIAQIKTFTEMDSHEEKLQKIIMESKMNEARDEARRKADTIEQSKCVAHQSVIHLPLLPFTLRVFDSRLASRMLHVSMHLNVFHPTKTTFKSK